jgi:6-phosphogluconolactonase
MLRFNEFADFSSLSQKLATQWLELVTTTPINQPCSFALAGGTTPAPVYRQFDALFAANPSRQIQLIATDERWVDDADPQSNEGLFRRCFEQSSKQWDLVSLKNTQFDPVSAIEDINQHLTEQCPSDFSAVMLGMGADGHIASLFPNAPELLVDDASIACVAALHPQTQQARMSLSFSRLLATQRIWLVITGAEKRNVLEQAINSPSATSPIAALLAAARCDVEVFWCP